MMGLNNVLYNKCTFFGDVTMLDIICIFHFNQTLSQCDYLRQPKYMYHWKRAAYCVIHAAHLYCCPFQCMYLYLLSLFILEVG